MTDQPTMKTLKIEPGERLYHGILGRGEVERPETAMQAHTLFQNMLLFASTKDDDNQDETIRSRSFCALECYDQILSGADAFVFRTQPSPLAGMRETFSASARAICPVDFFPYLVEANLHVHVNRVRPARLAIQHTLDWAASGTYSPEIVLNRLYYAVSEALQPTRLTVRLRAVRVCDCGQNGSLGETYVFGEEPYAI